MNLNSIWSVLEESSEILGDNYAYPAAEKAAEELLLPPDYFNWATAIWMFDADPFTVAQYMRYFSYGIAQANDERLTSAVRQDYLAADSQGTYRATGSGRTAALRLIEEGNDVMAALTPLPKESLRTLGNLLARISEAAFHSPEPPAHELIKAKRALYHGGTCSQYSKVLSLTPCSWRDTATIAISPCGARTESKITHGKFSTNSSRMTR